MKKGIFIFVMLLSQLLYAGDHQLTDIVGKDIQLKSYDHAIAGSVEGFVIFGNTSEEDNLSELTIKKHGQLIKATIKMNDSQLSGSIMHVNAGVRYETSIKFVSVDPREQKINLLVNNEPAQVLIKADGFANNHIINPKYIVTLSNGETFDFKFTNGGACYRASIHLTMLIISAYIH